jgi:anti-sigma factor RsiW
VLSCEEALEQMSQALDSPLTEAEQGALEAHLAGCPACRADWAALRELHQAMGELEETPAPEGFADRVMEQIREEARPAKVVPLLRRPQWKAAAGLAACAVICVGLYYGVDRAGLGVSGNVAAEPDLAQWSEHAAGSGAAPAASASDTEEALVQSKSEASAQPETQTEHETAGAPQSGAAGGECVLEGAAVPRTTQIQGQNAVGTAPAPALADGEAGGAALYSIQQEETELLLTALPEGAAELLPALDQWELDGQGRSFCTVSAQTLEDLCGALEAADVAFQRPEKPWSENCRVILAE